jgi:hypothetical protein
MKLELIGLRYIEEKMDEVITDHIHQILNQKEILEKWDLKIFRRNRMYMEVLIALISKEPNPVSTKSDFGLLLAESLRPFGSVIHDIWSEISP